MSAVQSVAISLYVATTVAAFVLIAQQAIAVGVHLALRAGAAVPAPLLTVARLDPSLVQTAPSAGPRTQP